MSQKGIAQRTRLVGITVVVFACVVLDGCATLKRIVPWGKSDSEPATSTTTDRRDTEASTADTEVSPPLEPNSERPVQPHAANTSIDLSVPLVDRNQPVIDLDDRGDASPSRPPTVGEPVDSSVATNAAGNPIGADDWGLAVQEAIHRRWVQPRGPKIPTEFSCDVMVKLTPFGGVDDVKMVRSCGDVALDASIETAVRDSSPLPIPKDPADFSNTLLLTFTPR